MTMPIQYEITLFFFNHETPLPLCEPIYIISNSK